MSKAKPIPDGYHTITPHLICRDAARTMKFYEQAFGAETIHCMTMPGGGIMHAAMRIGDSQFMIAEENPAWDSKSPLALGATPVPIHLYVSNVDASFQRAVQAGATAKMPPTDMFWGDRYAQVVDPSGHIWSIATHVKDMTPAEIEQAAMAMFASGNCGSDKMKS